jgi:hypothetical protein
VLRMPVHQVMVPRLAMVFMSNVSPILNPRGKTLETVVAPYRSPPHDSLRLDGTLEDDDPASIAVLTAGDLDLLPPAIATPAPNVQRACFWPTRYLVRPQLLTRL